MTEAEPVPVTIQGLAAGESLRLAWDRAVAASLRDEPEGRRSAWRLDGELDWQRAESLRLVHAVFENGRALAIAALRPQEAAGHDGDSVAAHFEESGEPLVLSEALLSTEYDADGLPRRIGVELWVEPDSPPLRVAADREGPVELDGDGIRRQTARMAFRLEGAGGVGAYEILRPA